VSPKIKYLLFQIPGWIITAIVLLMLLHWEFIPKWLAVLCFVAWLLKDLLLYPFLRRAYEPGVTGSARLVGSRGVAEGDLAPTGYVRVRGELWRAVVSPADVVVPSGTEVEVVSADRMEVFVRAVGARTGE
jgi:membrane protein implicated in regulation of membrane protease activity